MAERQSAEWTKNAGGRMGRGGQTHAWGARGHVTVCEARGLSLDIDRSEDEWHAGAVDGRHGMDGWPGHYLWQGRWHGRNAAWWAQARHECLEAGRQAMSVNEAPGATGR